METQFTMNSPRPLPVMSHAPVPAPSGLHPASALQPQRETFGSQPIFVSRRVWHVLASALILAVALLSAVPTARAADVSPPELMTYQGFLVDANGSPLASANPQNYPVEFRVYDAATGGVGVWAEQQIVTVDKGRFSVLLGEGNVVGTAARPKLSEVFSGAGASERYMELTVKTTEGDRTLLPRLQMLPAPYAFLARSANQLVNSAGVTLLDTSDGTLRGDASGLTGLLASQIPGLDASQITMGKLSAARLPAGIPVLNGTNTFNGNQRIVGSGNADHLRIVAGPTALGGAFLSLDAKPTGGDHYRIIASSFGPAAGKLVVQNFSRGDDIMTLGINGVGIGTTTPEAKLQVMGDLKFGGSGDQFAVGGGERLRIVRGKVNGTTKNSSGTGWRSERTSLGTYSITFDPSFSDVPVITVSPRVSGRPGAAAFNLETQNGVVVYAVDGNFDRADRDINFIAIGSR